MPNLYYQAVQAFDAKNIEILLEKSQSILDLLWDLDELLGSHPDFLLGTWLKSAKSIPDLTENEQKLFEFNARNQITLWGPEVQCLKISQKVSKMYVFRKLLKAYEFKVRQFGSFSNTVYRDKFLITQPSNGMG